MYTSLLRLFPGYSQVYTSGLFPGYSQVYIRVYTSGLISRVISRFIPQVKPGLFPVIPSFPEV